MASNNPNMKVAYTSDSSKFVAGTRQAKQAVRDFQKSTDTALNQVSEAFGVSGGKIGQITSSIKGLGVQMTQSGNAGVRAFGEMVASLDAVKLGIAGLGIGAAIASFQALNRVAENFKTTVAGANIEMATAAYVSTYQQVFFDMDKAQGQAFANFMAGIKKVGAAAGAIGTSLLVNQGSDLTTSLMGIASPTFWKETVANMKEANAKAKEAEDYARQIYDLQRLRSDKAIEIAETENKIASLKNIIWDKTNSEAERANALAQAQELIRQKYTEQYDIESQIADLMEATNNLASSTPEQIDAANQQRVKANNLVSQMNTELKSLIRQQNSLTGAVKETTAALSEEAKAQVKNILNQGIEDTTNRAELQNLGVSGITMPGATTDPTIALAGYVSQVQEVQKAIIDLNGAISDLAVEGAAAIGSLIGDLINGEDAWANFGNAAFSALGDFAVSVGKTIMQAGIAVEAAKDAVFSMNGVAAIAAGAALVAIGSALKTSLKNAANGNYSASSSVASSSYGSNSSYNRDYQERTMNVQVTGTLQASGNQLVAVLNNETNRKSHTT